MYLSKSERARIMAAYGCEDLAESDYCQVEPDAWAYLFCDKNGKKYVLIDADYLDFDFEVYPHLLKFNNSEFVKIEFVLQREIPAKNTASKEQTSGTLLFEYTD